MAWLAGMASVKQPLLMPFAERNLMVFLKIATFFKLNKRSMVMTSASYSTSLTVMSRGKNSSMSSIYCMMLAIKSSQPTISNKTLTE
jgi:hypothetical protein